MVRRFVSHLGFVLFIFAILIPNVGCRFVPNYEVDLQGSGQVVEDIRSVEPFAGILIEPFDEDYDNGISIRLRLTEGGDESKIKVIGEDNLIPHLVTTVIADSSRSDLGILRITSPYAYHLKSETLTIIEIPRSMVYEVRAIESNVFITGVAAPSFELNATEGKVNVAGKTDEFTMNLEGCNVKAVDLAAARVYCNADRRSQVTANAKYAIMGKLKRKSELSYAGEPIVNVETEGGSRIQKVDEVEEAKKAKDAEPDK